MNPIDYLRYDTLSKNTVLVGQSEKQVSGRPLEILEKWANTFGLGISGSQAAFKSRLAIRQKIPVLIDPYRQIYFFPTLSPAVSECLWINAAQVKAIKTAEFSSLIRFKDETVLNVAVGRRSLMKQWKRCQLMEHMILHNRLAEGIHSPLLLP